MNIIAKLKARGETVATAESLTGGLVCAELTKIPGASAVVRGGLIVYATDLKRDLAGVDADLLEKEGAVHPEVARQLAQAALQRCRATWGLGLTGVAGPDPQDGVSPGTVHIGLAGPGVSCVRTITVRGGRDEVRSAAVDNALFLLDDHLDVAGTGEH